jgi:protein gp37
MNRTKIEWCDYTWNPVTGCWGPGGVSEEYSNRCWYCYAKKMANRFYGDGQDHFFPQFHPERLGQPSKIKKPSRIFVCSMGDLFGDWVPWQWIKSVLTCAEVNQEHTFIFLTKNPARYAEFNPWPKNCWVGCTVTNQEDADERIPDLFKVKAPVRFVSVEPMLGLVDLNQIRGKNGLVFWPPCSSECPEWRAGCNPGLRRFECYHRATSYTSERLNWLIIGALTGPGAKAHQPKPEWAQSLIDQARAAGVPVFLKDNLKWPEQIQEWPG